MSSINTRVSSIPYASKLRIFEIITFDDSECGIADDHAWELIRRVIINPIGKGPIENEQGEDSVSSGLVRFLFERVRG